MEVVHKMVNDLTTLQGSLDEMKDQLISELANKGVTAEYSTSTGLLGLIAKISEIGEDLESEVIYNDSCTSDRTSNYDTTMHFGSTTNLATLTFDSSTNGYIFSGSGGDAFAGKVIPSIRGLDNISIKMDVQLRDTSAYNQLFIGMADELSQTSGDMDFFRIRGDGQVDYLHNGGSEIWKQSNVATFNGNWVTVEFKRQEGFMTGTVYDDEGEVLVTTTQELNTYSNPYYFFGVNTRYSSNTKYIRNIIVESFDVTVG